jgi:hypothetical protein
MHGATLIRLGLLWLATARADGHRKQPTQPTPAPQHLFVPGELGFTSYRGVVLVSTPGRLFAFTTGRCSGTPACRGDISARSIVQRSSPDGAPGSWSAPTIIANVSNLTLSAQDGIYVGTGAWDPTTKEVQLYWGECLEKCHPGQGGEAVMAAPSFFLTVSTDGFRTWRHINQTEIVESDRTRTGTVESFLPYNFFDNAAVVLPGGAGTVLAASIRNFSRPKHCQEAVCAFQASVCYTSHDHGRRLDVRGKVLYPPATRTASEYVQLDEPQLARFSNGTLVMIGHGDAMTSGRNTLAMATSSDNGMSFSGLHKIPGLVQPGCGLGLLVHDDIIYISHDDNGTLGTSSPNAHDASRNNLTVAHSSDGRTWTKRSVSENGFWSAFHDYPKLAKYGHFTKTGSGQT